MYHVTLLKSSIRIALDSGIDVDHIPNGRDENGGVVDAIVSVDISFDDFFW